ncbi:MAG: hypothetical protein Q7J56_03085, partial [Deltaproteobacteria bacterium]|nr:hypothetical protein [Deltaproteobacteria bacterium]
PSALPISYQSSPQRHEPASIEPPSWKSADMVNAHAQPLSHHTNGSADVPCSIIGSSGGLDDKTLSNL